MRLGPFQAPAEMLDEPWFRAKVPSYLWYQLQPLGNDKFLYAYSTTLPQALVTYHRDRDEWELWVCGRIFVDESITVLTDAYETYIMSDMARELTGRQIPPDFPDYMQDQCASSSGGIRRLDENS